MEGAEQISKLDQEIEHSLAQLEQLKLFESRLKDIDIELNKLHAEKDHLELKFSNQLKAFDQLIKLPALIRNLLSSKIDSNQVSESFAMNKMKYDAAVKEIELLLYEQKVLSNQQALISTTPYKLDQQLSEKEQLLKSYNVPAFRKLSATNLDIYSAERKLKHCIKLTDHCQRIRKDVELIVFASKELIKSLSEHPNTIGSYVFSYAERQKIKWMGRKLVQVKVELEKLINGLEIYLPEPEYYMLQFKTNHFVDYYITNLVKEIKDKVFRFHGLDDLMISLIKILDGHKHNIQLKQQQLTSQLNQLSDQKKAIIIAL